MAKKPELPALSDVQLEIMNVVWTQGECTVAAVWKELHAQRGVSRNTVQTLIARLEEKGWLTHSDGGSGFLYRATVSREKTQKRTVERLVRTVFGGSAEGLVLSLLGGETLSKAEAERIHRLIEQAKSRKS